VLKPTRYLVFITFLWLLAVPWVMLPAIAPPLTALSLFLLLLGRLGNRFTKGYFIHSTAFDGFIAIYLAMTAISFLLSPLPAAGLPKLLIIILGVFGYYLFQDWAAEQPAGLRPFTALLALGGGALALLAPFVLAWPGRQIFNLQLITDRLPHLSGAYYANNNSLAITLLLLFPFALAWYSSRRLPRLVGVALTILMAAVLVLTQSRSAFLSLAAAAILALVWGRFPLRWLVVAAVVPLLFFLLLLALTPLEGELSAGLLRLDASTKGGQVEAVSWLARLEIWRNAATMAADYPVFGAGLYTFDPLSRLNSPYQIIEPNFGVNHAHNLLLETAATTGWPAALALAGLWLAASYGLWQAIHHLPPGERRLARLYSASIVGYLTFNLFDTLIFGQKMGLLLWLIVGGAAVLLRQARIRLPHYPAVFPLLLLVLLCLTPALQRQMANQALDHLRLHGTSNDLAGLAGRLQGDPRRLGLLAFHLGDEPAALAHWRADPQAAAFLGSQGQQRVEEAHYEEAIAWCNVALALEPTAAWPAFWRGQAYEATGQIELALADYQTAAGNSAASGLSRSWQARLYYTWGKLLALNGDWTAAHAAFQSATALYPEIPWHYLLYWETH
jgi:O-antigen ligase